MKQDRFSALLDRLSTYDIITFDVFDTLITRCVLKPIDVFAIVEAQAKEAGIIANGGFTAERSQAETAAYDRFAESVSLANIYEILEEKYPYTVEQCGQLIELELETERSLVIPRIPVRELVQKLLSLGKRIILCSDMYLSSKDIANLLKQCGYPNSLEILVSNEVGGTKQSGGLWTKLFEALPAGKKVIHVGDNEEADYRSLRRIGREAVLLHSGRKLFKASALYPYLSKYADGSIGSSLILGYLVNKACFNSPFSDGVAESDIVSVWGGAVFACFMDFLVKSRKDYQLLFATREGYLLKPMYERYCCALEIRPQDYALFYASRAAAVAATVTSEKELRETMRKPEYKGTLGSFASGRLNFDISFDKAICDVPVELPSQMENAVHMLRPYFGEIFRNGQAQKEAYKTYIEQIRKGNKHLAIVDVGYNGTIQHAIAKILGEPVDGLYIFLNQGAAKKQTGSGKAIANPRVGDHPIYENLMFLEAVMQVPFGQLQKMELRDGVVTPVFNSDANFSTEIPAAQGRFFQFVEWIALWKRKTGEALNLDFGLAEAIWACMLKFEFLPEKLLDGFWIADDFGGHPIWKYDRKKQQWEGNQKITPLAFSVTPAGKRDPVKQKLKHFIKKHIPEFAFRWAQGIWINHIK